MILKNIEIQGFKSFADKIYLDFNSGITAIVGPNGSGKSNISDAIRWVMGEQSIKSLRGSKMEDVIFSGTEKRKALGFAEVTLTLDNSSGIFDIDFPDLQVTRRIYRSGESEYYINKTTCRLKDIHELFMDTGLGRDGYSIIGQGQIDNILSTKSEDRRQIFEEASGISKYKYRKNEAEKKLSQTTENLTRVKDILSELESQLEPLKKQSEKAKKYLVLHEEMKELEINVSVINIDKKREILEKLKEDIEIYENQINDIQTQITENDEKISLMFKESEEIDLKCENCRTEDRSITELIHEHTNNLNLSESDIKHSEDTISRFISEIDDYTKRMAELDSESKSLKDSLLSLTSQNDAFEKSSLELQDSANRAGVDVSEKSKEIEALHSEILKNTTNVQNIENSIENQKILIDNFSSRSDIIKQELNQKESDINNTANQLNKLEKDTAEKENNINDLKNKINQLEEKYGSKNVELQKEVSFKNKNNIKLGQITSKQKMLIDMERDLEGYSRGVKNIIKSYQQKKLSGITIHGPLSQLIKVDKKYITAVETALGNTAQNIVTDTPEDAKTAIKYLKQNNLGRATFLPISTIKAKNINNSSAQSYDGYIGTADSLCSCSDIYKPIISSVLSSTVVVDTIDNAVKMGKGCSHRFRIVTLGGDIIQAGGAMTGGSIAKSIGSLSRANEIENLAAEILKVEKIIETSSSKIKTLSVETNDLMDDIKNNNEKLMAYNETLIKLVSDKHHLNDVLNTMSSDKSKLSEELSDLTNKINNISNEISENKTKILSINKIVDELKIKADKEEKTFAELSGKNEKLTRTMLDLSIKKNTILKDIEQTNEKIQRVISEKEQILSSISNRQSEIEKLKNTIEDLRKNKLDFEKNIEKNKKLLLDTRTSLESYIKKRQEIDDKIKSRQASVNNIRETLFNLSGRLAKAQTKYENSETELESIINHLWEEYELTYSDASNRDLTGFDLNSSIKRITELKKEIKSLGNINIDSIEEYKTVSERVDFLTEQTNDLEKSKKELVRIIDEMLLIMKERFSEQFKIINENFSRVFSELFGGGQANLSLSDPDNVLESGIEIEAQPPGKKLQNLTLLSGGERAFTAIALLFSILNVRPTPFCILDEIEAALDDVNVYRFAEYLKQYSQNTQFIVVTHRRGTMESANILYGVTMQEKGVSKLLTLNIDEVSK